jgi:hypothetical protein
MDDDALILVADTAAAAAGEIRDHLGDCLRRLDLVNLTLPAAHLSFVIDLLDEDIRRLTATSVSELG